MKESYKTPSTWIWVLFSEYCQFHTWRIWKTVFTIFMWNGKNSCIWKCWAWTCACPFGFAYDSMHHGCFAGYPLIDCNFLFDHVFNFILMFYYYTLVWRYENMDRTSLNNCTFSKSSWVYSLFAKQKRQPQKYILYGSSTVDSSFVAVDGRENYQNSTLSDWVQNCWPHYRIYCGIFQESWLCGQWLGCPEAVDSIGFVFCASVFIISGSLGVRELSE